MSAEDIQVATVMASVARSLVESKGLDETLNRITSRACDSIPGVDFASISIRHDGGRLETVAPTDDITVRADALQYDYHEGPCFEAATDEKLVSTADVEADSRWPRYGPAAGALGLRGQLALELYDNAQSRGALNLYSRDVGVFADQHDLAELFAIHAAIAMGHVRTVDGLQVALATRKVIGQAIGITMQRYRIDEDRAFDFLIRVSQTGNIKLRDVALEVVQGDPATFDDNQ